MSTLFVADIGGTKSELALFSVAGSKLELLVKRRYRNENFTGVEQLLERFCAENIRLPAVGCIAVAGPVGGRQAKLTNLAWEVDCCRLEQRFGFVQLLLLNDLTALCSAVGHLSAKGLLVLQAGSGAPGSIRGVLAPGTGLGQGLVVDTGGQLFCQGSEGGHGDFAPADEEQSALLAWMRKKNSPVSREMVAGGPAIGNLYDFCRQYHGLAESDQVVETFATVGDRVPVIVENGVKESPCPLCKKSLDLFLAILGSEAGNLALTLYATGGIYLGGGILPRLAGRISFDPLLKGFRAKGVMSPFMERIPVVLILQSDATLAGAAHYGRQNLPTKKTDG